MKKEARAIVFLFVPAADPNSSSRAQTEHTTSPCRTLCLQSGAAQRWSSGTSGRTNRKTLARADGLEPGEGHSVKTHGSETSMWTKNETRHWKDCVKSAALRNTVSTHSESQKSLCHSGQIHVLKRRQSWIEKKKNNTHTQKPTWLHKM